MGVKANVIVTDLTYIKVGAKMELSVCITRTLSTKDSRIGQHKTAELVIQALSQINAPLSSIALFHSDRGKEFDNQLLDSCFEVFGITRSLSHKGCPYEKCRR